MIINSPSNADFENVAKQCLTQAFNIVYEIDKDLEYIDDVEGIEVWEYHLGDLSTSLILIYQAIESFTKARICESTPLLLLDLRRTDWPTLPNSDNKDFNELFTIGGESLMRTYCSVVAPENVDNALILFSEEIRLARNKIIHGPSRESLNPKYLVTAILKCYTFFMGKDSWWIAFRDLYTNNPLFGYFNNDFEEALLIEKFEYANNVVGAAEFRKHFTLNLRTRKYYCPWCDTSLMSESHDLDFKWSVLTPQGTPNVTELTCLSCQRVSTVIRENCEEDDCLGNVLFDGDYGICCQTCKAEQLGD